MIRLVFEDAKSHKFWEGSSEGSTFTVRFGKVGTDGQTRVKDLGSAEKALAQLEKKAAEKRKKGYVDDAPVPAESSSIHLVFEDGKSHKFWEGTLDGKSFAVRFGKVGSDGQVRTKELGSADEAAAALQKKAAEKRKKGYVDQAPAAAPAQPPEATGAPPAKAALYPFLFFGQYPADFHEGSNCGYEYEVRFVEAPAEAERKEFEKAFELALEASEAADGSCRRFTWSGEWVRLVVGDEYLDWIDANDGVSFGLYGRLWDDMASAFEKLHASWPIAEVVNRNARHYGDCHWTSWSLEQQKEPGSPPPPGHG